VSGILRLTGYGPDFTLLLTGKIQMLHSAWNVQVSDTTGDDRVTKAGKIKTASCTILPNFKV